jgi:hypothetical protein
MPFNRLNHSVLGEIRPRFYLKTHLEPDEAADYIALSMEKEKTVSGVRTNRLIFLKTPSWLQHYWSPEMTVRIEKGEFAEHTTICCLLGPRQSVWAMFALTYAAILLITIFGGMFGLVQYSTSGSSQLLWVLPIGIIALSTVFISAKLGQKKGRDQSLHLVSFLYHTLAEKGEVERIERH